MIQVSLKFVLMGAINYKQALIDIMAWHRIRDKPLNEPMAVKFTDTSGCLGLDESHDHLEALHCPREGFFIPRGLIYHLYLSSPVIDHDGYI